jgi:cytochrome c-type biogenesis protein CcmH/NrfG
MHAGVIFLTVSLFVLPIGVWLWWASAPRPEPPIPDLSDADPKVAEAISQARQEVLRVPRSAPAWGRLGMVMRAHDFAEEANVCFEQAEHLDPREPRWPYLHGLTLVLTNPQAGILSLERAVARTEGQLAPRLRLAEVLLEQGRLEEAERNLRVAIEREPDYPRTHLGLARLAFAREDWAGGLKHLEGNPGKLAHTLRAEAWQQLGKTERSAEELKRARELPDDPPWPDPFVEEVVRLQVGVRTQLVRADALSRQRRSGEAVALLEEIVQAHPENGEAWLLLGQILVRQRHSAQAERALEQAVRVDPNSVEAWFQLGVARVFQHNPRGAMDAFSEVVRLKPDHTLGHFNLGLCRKQLGDRAGAAGALRQALRCQPDHEPARKALNNLNQ